MSRSGERRDGGGGRRLDVRHGDGGGGQGLLSRRLGGRRLLHGRRHLQGGLCRCRDLQGRVGVRGGLRLQRNLRLSRGRGLRRERERLRRDGVRQEGLGLEAVRDGLHLPVERRLLVWLRGGRDLRLALGHGQRLQGRVRRREPLGVKGGALLDVRMRGRRGQRLAGCLGCWRDMGGR